MPSDEPRPRRDGWSIGAAVGVVGLAFGALASASGVGVAKSVAMSLLVFTGASQFALVSVAAGGGSVAAAMGSAVLLAVRNGLYGPVVARWFGDDPLPAKLVVTQLIIDESTAVGAAQPDAEAGRRGFLAGGVAVYVFWNLGTLVGALVGSSIGDLDRWGLDAAFPAAFVALLLPHLSARPARLAALLAAALCLGGMPLLPVGVPVLVATLAVVPATLLRRTDGAQ